MIDAEIRYVPGAAVASPRARRLPPMLGLGVGAVLSLGLWTALILTISRLL